MGVGAERGEVRNETVGAPILILWFCGFISQSAQACSSTQKHHSSSGLSFTSEASRRGDRVGGLVGTLELVESASGGAGGGAWSSRQLCRGLALRRGVSVGAWRAGPPGPLPTGFQESTGQEAPPTEQRESALPRGGRHVEGDGALLRGDHKGRALWGGPCGWRTHVPPRGTHVRS